MTDSPQASPAAGEAAGEAVRKALADRREAALLSEPSVARMAELLAVRCREPVWVRTCVVTLDRFAELAAPDGLGRLLEAGRADTSVTEEALRRFADRLPPCTDTQLSALCLGPKVWLRVGGVGVPWRAVAEAPVAVTRTTGVGAGRAEDPGRVLLLAMINSGLSAEEVLSLQIGDVGSIDADARLVPDRYADPMAVWYLPAGSTDPGERRLTFLNYEARAALSASWAARVLAGEALSDGAPLVAAPDGSAGADALAQATSRHEALIGAGNELNVFMCRMTGDFFREWGMPGSRFLARGSPRNAVTSGADTDPGEELSPQ